jgi:hypothetical protein
MATIEDLKAAMSAKAPARPDRYRVRIPGLNAAGDILCQATNLPGRQITTTERRIGMVTQKMPYSKTVEIQQLDKETESVVYGVRLKNAFPVTISPIELGDGLQNQITQVNVQLAFTDWERTT